MKGIMAELQDEQKVTEFDFQPWPMEDAKLRKLPSGLLFIHNSKKIIYLDIQNGFSALCITKSPPGLAFLHTKGGGPFVTIVKKSNLHMPIFPKHEV